MDEEEERSMFGRKHISFNIRIKMRAFSLSLLIGISEHKQVKNWACHVSCLYLRKETWVNVIMYKKPGNKHFF